MPAPVVIVESGGVPFRQVAAGRGTPFTVVPSGGIAITLVETGGTPISLYNADGSEYSGAALPPMPTISPTSGSVNNSDPSSKIILNLPDLTQDEVRSYQPTVGPAFAVSSNGDLIRGLVSFTGGSYSGLIIQDNGQDYVETPVTITATDVPVILLTEPPLETADDTPLVSGSVIWNDHGVSGLSVTIKLNGVTHGTTTTDGSGNYSYEITPALSAGVEYTIEVSVDVPGTQSAATNVTVSGATAIAFVSSATAQTTVTLPAHSAGQLLLGLSYRDGSTTPPSVPAGWSDGGSWNALAQSVRLAYKFATSSAEANPAFTNGTNSWVGIYTGANTTDPIGGLSAVASGSTGTVTANAPTFEVTDGTSWQVSLGGARNTSATLVGTRNTHENATATSEMGVTDSNGTRTAGATQSHGASNGNDWIAVAFELKS